MTSIQIEIMIVASIVAISCSLVGVFLVLRKMAMMSDAITHTVLLGIVIAFFITKDLSSPLLMVGAGIMGVITVFLVESLKNTRLLSEEASIGVVFPFIFSIAVVLISKYAGNVHLDTDAVLLGELAFVPLERMTVFGLSIPSAMFNAIIILIIDVVVITLLFKEFKLSSFDAILAGVLGFSPILLNYLLMTLVSITAVGAFNAVGSILVIAFMIGPPITAYLMTHNLKVMIVLSTIISIVNVVLGYQMAVFFDVSIAGSMAVMTGITFTLVFLFSRREGYITRKYRSIKQHHEFNDTLVLLHLYEYESKQNASLTTEALYERIQWQNKKLQKILNELTELSYIEVKDGRIHLTDLGSKEAFSREVEIFDR